MSESMQNASGEAMSFEETVRAVDETLHLMARLPAPEGLAERVEAGLRAAPRKARVLHWPAVPSLQSGWMRGAAAAAIVFVVVGGGWGVYSRVQPAPASNVVVMPPRVNASGGFSSAGAMRTPQTLERPVVIAPAQPAAKPVTPLRKVARAAKVAPAKDIAPQVK